MNVRERMNKCPAVTMIGAFLLLSITVSITYYILSSRGIGSPSHSDEYYYDLNSGNIFVSSTTADIPPFETGSGQYHNMPAGVRIRIFSCGGCADFNGLTLEEVKAEGGFPVWLEMYTMDVKQKVAKGELNDIIMLEDNLLVRTIGGKNWVPRDSPAGRLVVQQINTLCSDDNLKLCRPGR